MSWRTKSRRLVPAVAVACVALAGTAAPVGAAVLPADTTAVISGTPDLLGLLPWLDDGAFSSNQSVSRTSSFVAFESTSDGLVAGDDDDVSNVYVKNVETGELLLASVAVNGAPSHTDCGNAVLSDDGTKVAFECTGALDPADVNGTSDVYVRDTIDGRTTLVSRASALGAVGNAQSFDPAISATGRFVAFTTRATNFGDEPLNISRVYRREVGNGDATLLMSRANGVTNVTDASNPSISNDGSRVALETRDGFAFGDQNNQSDVYTRDVLTGDLHLTSRKDGAAVAAGNGASTDGVISGDGQSVAFTSAATDLDAADPSAGLDVYRRTFQGDVTDLLSVRAGTGKLDGNSRAVSISDDGRRVGFTSDASIGGVRPSSPQAYVVSENNFVVRLGRDGPAGPPLLSPGVPSVSGDGVNAVFDISESRSVVLRGIEPTTTRTVSRPPDGVPFDSQGGGEGGSVSADGRFVAFSSGWAGFGLPAGVDEGVFVRDVATGAVTLVSRQDGDVGAPIDGFFANVQISGDGRRVAFASSVPGGLTQILVRDVVAKRTFVASRANGDAGALANDDSSRPTISDDGARVAFQSFASNLAAGDTDLTQDVFVRDLASGTTLLVDRASGATAVKANQRSANAAISGDGRHVAFETEATNLAADPSGKDVYVRDVDTSTTRLVSVTGAATKGNGDSVRPSISRDGNRVSFFSSATNFGEPAAGTRLYVRDSAAGTLTIAGRADGPQGAVVAMETFFDGLLSADGQHIAFVARPQASIAPGAPADGQRRVYERDLATGATRLIMRGSGAAGAPSLGGSEEPIVGGITADGGCVTFTADGRVLPAPASGDLRNVFMRAVTADCRPTAAPPPPPAPPTPPPPPTPPGPTAKAAVLSGLALKPARFHVGGRTGGTKVLFRLDKASVVSLRFERLAAGRKQGKRCSTKVRTGRRCTVATLVGRLTVAASRTRGGANSVAFSGKLGGKALKPGRYRLTATPLKGAARTVELVVVKAPKAQSKSPALPRREVHG